MFILTTKVPVKSLSLVPFLILMFLHDNVEQYFIAIASDEMDRESLIKQADYRND